MVEQGFCNSSTDSWLRAASKLIYEQNRLSITFFCKLLHIRKVRTVCTQVVLDALLITDVDQNVVEDSHLTVGMHRHKHSALRHILDQSDTLQADTLTSGIRAGNKQYSVVFVEMDVERNNLLARRLMG